GCGSPQAEQNVAPSARDVPVASTSTAVQAPAEDWLYVIGSEGDRTEPEAQQEITLPELSRPDETTEDDRAWAATVALALADHGVFTVSDLNTRVRGQTRIVSASLSDNDTTVV